MELRRDLVGGLRSLRRMPGVALLIVLTLGLAIGANAAVFSLIDRVALRPLPVENPHELVLVSAPSLPFAGPGLMIGGGRVRGMDYPLAAALRDGLSDQFSAAAIRRAWRFTLGTETAVEVRGEFVNADYFAVFGLRALAGRILTPAETAGRDGPPVVVLNHGFWMRQFGGDPSIVSRTIRLNNVPVTVVGVLGPGYSGTTVGGIPELFLPLGMGDELAPVRGFAWDAPTLAVYTMVGRLKPGVDRVRAEAAGRVLYQRLLDQAIARGARLSAKSRDRYKTDPLQLHPAGTVGSEQSGAAKTLDVPLRLLLAMTVFVLVVAAGNVANLLLARGIVRAHETAVCLALGARRRDLLRPRLVESLALSVAAGCAALLFAFWSGTLVPTLLGLGTDLAGVNTRPDARVVFFTAVVSLATGLLVWLASAFFLTRRRALPNLAASQSLGGAGASALGLRRGFVIVQVALSLALLCSSALLSRSLYNVLTVDPGFDAEGLWAFSVNPGVVGYDGDRLAEYERALLARVRALPGVRRAAATSMLPLTGAGSGTVLHGPGVAQDERLAVDVAAVDEEFFATLGLPLAAGRAFDERDVDGAPEVCVVNEALARALAGGHDIVGQMVGYEYQPATLQVVGVVSDSRNRSLKTAVSPALFLPRRQTVLSGRISVLARAAVPGAVSAATVAALVKELDAGVAVSNVGSIAEFARALLLRERMLAGLSLVFAGLSALVAGMGLSGLASFNVTRRTREIGIRVALGATPAAIEKTVLGEVAALAAVGAGIGLALFAGASRVLQSQLFEVAATDPPMVALATLVLALVTCAAGLLPARRASRVDPAVTLRYE